MNEADLTSEAEPLSEGFTRGVDALAPVHPRLRASVVVPARDEELHVARCLHALADQRGVAPEAYEVIVVLDRCRDATRERALQTAAARTDLRLHILQATAPGVGAARRLGMDLACARLLSTGRRDGLVVSTDADTVAEEDWLACQLSLSDGGAQAIGGRILLDDAGAGLLADDVLRTRRAQARVRLEQVRSDDAVRCAPASEHHQFSGASMSLTAEAYERVGGLPPVAALEDEALARLLEAHAIAIVRSEAVRVRTSARTDARAPRGLARDLALADWRARRSFTAGAFSVADLARARRDTVSVILPTRDVAQTVGHIVACVDGLRRRGLIDEILLVDANSADATAQVARAQGASVLQENDLMPEFGPARGKGDAMWRGLSAARGDIVVYVDADTERFSEAFVVGLLGPLLTTPQIALVKGAFQRPFRLGDQVIPGEGGRVTELVARPLLNLYAPQLAAFDQPLAGEFAARRWLLERLAFPVGYGVEIATLIDAEREVGMERLAQSDLGERQNRHQPLRELSAMAYAVMVAAGSRLHGPELLSDRAPGPLALPPQPGISTMEVRQVALEERPPLCSLARGARAPGVRLAAETLG